MFALRSAGDTRVAAPVSPRRAAMFLQLPPAISHLPTVPPLTTSPSLQLRLSPTSHSEPLNPHLPPLTCNLSSHLSHPLYFLISPHLTPHTHTSHLSTLTSPLTLTSHYLLTPHHCTHPTTLLHLSLITSHPHLSSPLLISPTPLLTL